ncbi:MAG: phosphomethylpyrimidine synthase ThiC [Clostridia bacterium]|nr:phosphomethylpyrimidine synthase ThiC [Clostridia bacterium]
MKMIIGNIKRNNKLIFDTNGHPLVLASIGASQTEDSIEEEVRKAVMAEKYGADIIIDHTLTPNHYVLQKRVLESTNIPVSSIAVYDLASMKLFNNKKAFNKDDVINGIKSKAELGIDLMTIHAGVLYEDINYFKNNGRIISCTSRGGTMVIKNMMETHEENYYWTCFDEILDIAKQYNITISLGTTFRPANISDAVNMNEMYWKEVERNAVLVKKAQGKGVNIMVEGIGHCPIDMIPDVVKKTKKICHDAPYRVLTVATDCALGFDHVSSAIAASAAVMAGANCITAVTRSEHLGLPRFEDVKEAITSARIAAHCGYIARTHDYSKDIAMAKERNEVGCKGAIDKSIIPEITKEELKKCKIDDEKKCTMCGSFCALKSSDEIQKGV